MNDDQDLLMRQIKSFAQGLGAAMSKKDRRQDDPVVVFHDAEVSLASYQAKLITEVKENGFSAAKALSLIHISEPTRRHHVSRMPSSA